MDTEDVIKMVIGKLGAIIFELEQIKSKDIKYTIDIKDKDGRIIKSFSFPEKN